MSSAASLGLAWAVLATAATAPLALSAAEELFADFEASDYGSWTATGSAFGTGPARGTLPNQQKVGGFRGNGLVNSYLGGDGATGTLTSPEFVIRQPFLNFLIGGGAQEARTCVNVLVGGRVVRSATGKDDEFLNMATFDLGEYVGQRGRIQIIDEATGGWGHVNADHFVFSDSAATPPVEPVNIDTSRLYDETYRPQFHFSPRENWMNDPNGLVYFGGEYHLFFQHNPSGREWGNMTWGHAVSSDLVHWRQQEHALFPDVWGTMFSGSAVVDRSNTAGFQTGRDPALVACYTAAGGTSEASKGRPFTQCLAYSNDRGRTWTKYAENPVLPNVGEGDRDPKVFWHAPTRRWVMPLYVGERQPGGPDGKGTVRHTLHFYTSPDLKTWSFASRFAEEVYECPGLVELPVEGLRGETRWVLWGADASYWIGRFDGRAFTAESTKLTGDFGANSYAAQAYDDLPDKRVVFVTWMRGGRYPGMPFNQQMGFPQTLNLRPTSEGLRLHKWPVKEIEVLRDPASPPEFRQAPLAAVAVKIGQETLDLADLELAVKVGDRAEIRLDFRGFPVEWRASDQTLRVRDRSAHVPAVKGILKLRFLLDRTSLETFANEGAVLFSDCFTPPPKTRSITLTGQDATVELGKLWKLRSAWRNVSLQR